MPIYSRNSTGGIATVAANENYSYADMGQILVECVQNDMTVFNAALLNDFKENSAIREGTMVSSELMAFREFSVKEAWNNLKEKLKKLWEKIKGVFRKVFAQLTVWLVRNGKAFVAIHRKTLSTKAGLGDCEIPKYKKFKSDFANRSHANDLATRAKNTIESYKNDASNVQKTEHNESAEKFTNFLLNEMVPGATVSNFAEKYKEAAFESEQTNVKWSALSSRVGGLEGLFTNITAKSDALKKLKKQERDTDKAIKSLLKTLSKKESEADKNESGSGASYKLASNVISGFERALTLVTRATIQAIKFSVSQDRMVVGKLAAYSPTKESALLEHVAWCEGADDFATQEDIPAEEIDAPDVQSDPDAAVVININADECDM